MKKKILPQAKTKVSADKSTKAEAPAKSGKLFRRLKAAVAEMKSIQAGKALPTRVWEVIADGRGGFTRRQIPPETVRGVVKGDSAEEALRARQKLGLSQDTFAALLGVSAGTLRGWEQGRRKPTQAARVLLRVATKHPAAVLAAARVA